MAGSLKFFPSFSFIRNWKEPLLSVRCLCYNGDSVTSFRIREKIKPAGKRRTATGGRDSKPLSTEKRRMKERMLTDIEIAQQAKLQPIAAIAAQLGSQEEELEPYGR